MKKVMMISFMALTIGFASNLHAAQNGKSVLTKPRATENAYELRPHVALLVGVAQPEGSGDTSSELGIDVGYQPYIPYGLSAEFNHSRINDGAETNNRDTLWIKGTYNLGGDMMIIKNSYAGVGFGSVFKTNGTSLAVAPIVGFDIPMNLIEQEIVSLGLSSRYAIVGDNEVDTFSLAGVVKYWF